MFTSRNGKVGVLCCLLIPIQSNSHHWWMVTFPASCAVTYSCRFASSCHPAFHFMIVPLCPKGTRRHREKKKNTKEHVIGQVIVRFEDNEQSHHPTLQEVFLQSIITVGLRSFLRGKSHLLPLLPRCCDYKRRTWG